MRPEAALRGMEAAVQTGASWRAAQLDPVFACGDAADASASRSVEFQSPPPRLLLLFGALLPTIYLWSLPLLANWCSFLEDGSCFAYRCAGYPACVNSFMGVELSILIQTPPATGLMALAFGWPFSHLWLVQRELGLGSAMLCVYQFSFGLFLTFSDEYFPMLHGAATGSMFASGTMHYAALLRRCHQRGSRRRRWCEAVLTVAIVSFVLVCISDFVGWAFRCPLKTLASPWLFYCMEAAGMSAMSLFPWVWELSRTPSGQAQTGSANSIDVELREM